MLRLQTHVLVFASDMHRMYLLIIYCLKYCICVEFEINLLTYLPDVLVKHYSWSKMTPLVALILHLHNLAQITIGSTYPHINL